MRASIVLLTIVLLTPATPGQSVLVYNSLPSGELAWYSGFGSLAITYATEPQWQAMSTAQFAAFDLIFIGASTGTATPYPTLFSTRATWQPAVNGRIVVHGTDPAAHATPGSMTFTNAIVTWVLAGPGTGMIVGSDIGQRGLDFLDAWGITGCVGFNCFSQDTVIVTMPGHPSMAGVTSAAMSGWGWTTHNSILTFNPDFVVTATGPAGEAVVLVKEPGPQCAFTSPPALATVGGDVAIGFDATHTMSLPVDLTFEFSTDGGTTYANCTAAPSSTLPNPALAVGTPLLGGSFRWDSIADGVGFTAPQTTTFRISADDGSVTGDCRLIISVDNVIPPPTCSLILPPSPGRGEIAITVNALSVSSPLVVVLLDFSTDGGFTFAPATMAATSPNPNPAVGVSVGPVSFRWDSRADAIGLTGLVTGVLVRATVNDGVAPLNGSCQGLMDIENTMICNGICGDCNLNAIGPDIIDALTAAQIAVALIVPTTEQAACCDVNSSTIVDVIDALFIAQVAAGLPAVLVCM